MLMIFHCCLEPCHMIDLSRIEQVYLYPGKTDMRLGMTGLRKLVGEMENNSLYVFCGMGKNQIKVIEQTADSTWLYQKKLKKGKFSWPIEGEKTLVDKEQLLWVIEGISLINKIETNSKQNKYDYI